MNSNPPTSPSIGAAGKTVNSVIIQSGRKAKPQVGDWPIYWPPIIEKKEVRKTIKQDLFCVEGGQCLFKFEKEKKKERNYSIFARFYKVLPLILPNGENLCVRAGKWRVGVLESCFPGKGGLFVWVT